MAGSRWRPLAKAVSETGHTDPRDGRALAVETGGRRGGPVNAATDPLERVDAGGPRLEREGVPVGDGLEDPERRLFQSLLRTDGDLAHARYSAYL